MNKMQFTLTVKAGKWIIAKAISERKEVKAAISRGKVVLFGGTTVSAVSEMLIGRPLRISGRITSSGTITSLKKENEIEPQSLVIYNDKTFEIRENRAMELIENLDTEDIVITGANAYDSQGYAAMMSGSIAFGERKNVLPYIYTEGAQILIAAGIEKFIPNSIRESIRNAGRNKPVWSMGCSVGLVPIIGEVVNELEALKMLIGVHPVIIGKGGIYGGEGSTTMVAEGDKEQLEDLLGLLKWASEKSVSGIPESLRSCEKGSVGCKNHVECCYKSGKDLEKLH